MHSYLCPNKLKCELELIFRPNFDPKNIRFLHEKNSRFVSCRFVSCISCRLFDFTHEWRPWFSTETSELDCTKSITFSSLLTVSIFVKFHIRSWCHNVHWHLWNLKTKNCQLLSLKNSGLQLKLMFIHIDVRSEIELLPVGNVSILSVAFKSAEKSPMDQLQKSSFFAIK